MRCATLLQGSGVQTEIADQIAEGAASFLITEYKCLVPFVVVVFAFIVGVLEGQDAPLEDDLFKKGYSTRGGWQTAICFLVGAALSATAGWFGMKVATDTNVKTMEAAKSGMNPALKVAFAGGAVMGFTVVSTALLGITILFAIFTFTRTDAGDYESYRHYCRESIRYLTGFGFGASAIALFARVAGGIYTKAADVGADLVGKVQADIPEDDPRNPATIADNVGDNVGDVAGMGADLFESFAGSIIAAAALASSTQEMALPFWIAGFGVLSAVIGFFTVSTKDDASQEDLLHSIHRGINVASALVVGFSALTVYILFDLDSGNETGWCNMTLASDGEGDCELEDRTGWKYFGCILIGLVSGVAIGMATEYSTSYAYAPVQSITQAGQTGGAATVIIQGLGVGMLSCVPPVVIIVVAIIACYELGDVYGIAVAAVGMLSTLGVTLATDAYGPVADNAGGIAEMSPDCPEDVRERTDKLDALGNTTAATGKGFAIGSAVLTALALMNAFVSDVPVALSLRLTDPLVLAGVVLGAMLPYLFGAFTMLSVRKAADAIIVEVQDQFQNIPGLLAGEPGVKPNTKRCVDRCTMSSVREMILPGLVAVMMPPSIGLLIGANALGGMLIGAISSGFMLAVMMSNAGGAWDNSKKYIENEQPTINGEKIVKKSETHKACVVGDTVGDPFKDTSGPSLNILIKLMSVMSLTLAPIFRGDWTTWWEGVVCTAVMLVLVIIAYYYVWVKAPPPPESVDLSAQKKEEA